MNSAKRVRTKSARKIHSDQKPRALARKFCSLRRLSGEISMPSRRSAARAPPMSDLPALEVDARIDNGIHDVADDVHQQAQQGEEVERAEHHRVVAVERRLEAEQPQPVQRADHLDEQRARSEGWRVGKECVRTCRYRWSPYH